MSFLVWMLHQKWLTQKTKTIYKTKVNSENKTSNKESISGKNLKSVNTSIKMLMDHFVENKVLVKSFMNYSKYRFCYM